MADVSFYKVILVGIFQVMAIMPGVSISGATILEVLSINTTEVVINAKLFIGMVVSFVSGMFSICVLMNIIKKGKLYYFAIYVVIVAVAIILFF